MKGMTLSSQEISDRLEIEQLLIRYCHAIDERDWDTYRSVYTDDAVIDDISAPATPLTKWSSSYPKHWKRWS
jgi:ketosteroid isomerase-like protein